MRTLKPVPPGESYLDAIRAEFQKTYPGRAFAEAAFQGEIREPAPAAAGLEYPIAKLHFREAEVPASFQHRLRLTLSASSGRPTYLNMDLVLPEMTPQPFTLSFSPASAADQKIVKEFGAIEHSPAALVDLIPEFRLGDTVVVRGSTPIPLGTALDLSVNHTPPVPAEYAYVNTNHHAFTAGETAAIVLNAHTAGAGLAAERVSLLINRLATASADEAKRLLLDLAALRYLQRVEADEQQLSGPLQVRFFPDDEVGNAITFASLDTQMLFDRPFVVTPGRLKIHAWPTCLPYVDLNHNDHNDPVVKTAWQLHNDAISVLEHEIWEEFVMIPSVSTIKILQAAIRENNPIHIITSSNAKTEISALEVPQAIKDMLPARISAGAVLSVP